jgi:hypothetical protein
MQPLWAIKKNIIKKEMRAAQNFFVEPYTPLWTNHAHVIPPPEQQQQTPDYHQNHDDNDDGSGEAVNPEPEYFEARPLKSRRLEIERLGEPPERASCFGCVYFGENENDAVLPSDEIRHLIEMSRQSIGRVDMLTLAEAMADYFEEHIRKPCNRRLRPNEKPLRPWPASQILEHIRHHNQDPLVQQVVLLAEIQELRTDLLERCFEVSNKTGNVRANKHNVDCYEKMVKLQLHVQKQDASKMAFYHGGTHINPEILNQGVLSTHTKNVHTFWKIH